MILLSPLVVSAKTNDVQMIPDNVKLNVLRFISKDTTPLPLSTLKYANDTKNNPKDYTSYYFYGDKVQKIGVDNKFKAIPFLYSTENKERVGDGYARCSILVFSSSDTFIPNKKFNSKYSEDYSSCLGYKSIKMINVNKFTWIIGTVSYEVPQNGDSNEWLADDFYFFDASNNIFCYDSKVATMTKAADTLNELRTKLESYNPEYEQCSI